MSKLNLKYIEGRYGKMAVLEDDPVISKSFIEFGEWAQLELDSIKPFIAKGDFVIDIGAFIGSHTRAFSEWVGINGMVFSFEPRQLIFEVLQENASFSKYQNIVLNNCGLGVEKTILTPQFLAIQGENAGAFSLESFDDKGEGSSLTENSISIAALDDFTFSSLKFIKIDVEGMEPKVLEGAKNTIQKFRPIIFAECNSLGIGEKLLAWARDNTYQAYGLLSRAFNPDNYFSSQNNFFSLASELGILFLPLENITSPYELDLDKFIISDMDALALFMLHKKQYPYEVFERLPCVQSIGIDFPSPLSERLQSEIATLQLSIAEKNKQLEELNSLSNSASALDIKLQSLGKEYEHAQVVVEERDLQLKVLNEQLFNLGKELEYSQSVVTERDNQLKMLNAQLQTNGEEYRHAQTIVKERDLQLKTLNDQLSVLGKQLEYAQSIVSERDRQLLDLNGRLQTLAEEYRHAQKIVAERDLQLADQAIELARFRKIKKLLKIW